MTTTPTDPRLVFVTNYASPEGFRSGEGTDDEIVVRELVQNALDAGADKIHFSTVQIHPSQIPDIDGYRTAVAAIHPDLKETSVARAALERINKALKADTVTCLLCTDNGNGLGLDGYQRLLSEAMSDKVGAAGVGKRGSVGVGHLTALDVSDMRYVLYASKGPNQIFGGQTMLATQRHNKTNREEHKARQGYLTARQHIDGFRGYNAQPADPASIPDWLTKAFQQPVFESGTTVAILAYNHRGDEADNGASDIDGGMLSDEHMNRIFDAAAKHFMVALNDRELTVSYSSESIPSAELDETDVNSRLEANQHRRRANRRGYGSGAKAWDAWVTLTTGDPIVLDNGARLWWRLTPGKTSTVTVFRNGMRITHDAPRLRSHDFAGVKAFNAVVDAGGELATALKECETDSHLDIKISQAPTASREKAKTGLQQVQDTLIQTVGKIDTEDWVPDVLRIFNGDNDTQHKIEPAPPRPRPPDPEHEQQSFQVPDPEGTDTEGDEEESTEGAASKQRSDEHTDRPIKPRAWRPGSLEGLRRSFVPVNDTEAVIAWDFTGHTRRPSNVGVAVVVGSGSQPSDPRPVPDQALEIRREGSNDEWTKELKVPATEQITRVEVRNAPQQWAAVTAVVCRRS